MKTLNKTKKGNALHSLGIAFTIIPAVARARYKYESLGILNDIIVYWEGCVILKLLHDPMLFQGNNKSKPYFEGWYFRQVSADYKKSISIIPGITKNTADAHAFIQTILCIDADSKTAPETHYHIFSPDDFQYTNEPFCLEIGNNTFKRDGIEMNLSDSSYSLQGNIHFSPYTEIKSSILFPNIMGYFGYLSFMECYHGIVSMGHYLQGALMVNTKTVNFTNGKGYIEKDWGTSFPKEYVWLQSNNFPGSDASIVCSIADIPFMGTSFQGFICNLSLSGREYRFASYNHSKLIKQIKTEDTLDITLTKNDLMLKIRAKVTKGGVLKAPKNGAMNHAVKEGLNGIVDVTLLKKSGETIFAGTGYGCAIEIVKAI